MGEQMTSMERLMAVIHKQIPDRVPFILEPREYSLAHLGVKFSECYKDPDIYVQAQLKMLEDYHVDSVWDIWCTPAVDEAMGAHMEIPDDDAPWIHEPIIHSKDDIAKLKIVDPYQDGRLPYMLEVIRRLRKAVGPDVPLFAWTSQAFRTACMLRGSAQLYLDVILEPQLVKDLLEISLINLKAYCKAAIEAGADVICTSNPVANMDCISRKHFEEFSHPYTMELFKACKEYGAKATMYHTCGLWTDRFDLLCQENIDMFHVDKVDIPEFKKQYSDYVVTMGNVRTVVSLLQGTPEHVFEETKRCLEEGKPGGRYVISGDCAVPRDTPHENVLAMAEAVQKYAAY